MIVNEVISVASLYLFCIYTANSLGISSKLDFGKPNVHSQSPGIRPDINAKSNYRIDGMETNLDPVRVICVAENCETTKTKTETDSVISTDVLVHVKTKTDTNQIKNETSTATPDIPIIIGTKTSTFSPISNNPPNIPPSSLAINSNYPVINFLPTLSPNNPFILPSRSNFFPNTELQTDPRILGLHENNNYVPGFQSSGNGIELERPYAPPTFNFRNNNPTIPLPNWRSTRVGPRGYNPVEFRKTYHNTWTPIKWDGGNSFGPERRIGNNIPRWTPCVCEHSEGHYNPTTIRYDRSSRSYVNDKLGSLN